jgi:hypothetical protein
MSFLRRHRFGFPYAWRNQPAPWLWLGLKSTTAVPVGYVSENQLHLTKSEVYTYDFTIAPSPYTGTPPLYCNGETVYQDGIVRDTQVTTYASNIKLAHQSTPATTTAYDATGTVNGYTDVIRCYSCDMGASFLTTTLPRIRVVSTISYNPLTGIYRADQTTLGTIWFADCARPGGYLTSSGTSTGSTQNAALAPVLSWSKYVGSSSVPTPTLSTTYSSPVSYSAWPPLARTSAANYLTADAGSFTTTADPTLGSQYTLTQNEDNSFVSLQYPSAQVSYGAFRFFLPASHHPQGHRILSVRILYDIHFVPASGASSVYSADQVVTFDIPIDSVPSDTWPADPLVSGWWLNAQVTIPIPTSPGLHRVANIRHVYSFAQS